MTDILKKAEQNPRYALALLWICLLAGPLAWTLQLAVLYPSVGWTCAQERTVLLHGITVLALLLSLGAAYLSWHNLRLHRSLNRINESPRSGRAGSRSEQSMPPREFMALGGLWISLFFTLVIIMQWLPVQMLDACD